METIASSPTYFPNGRGGIRLRVVLRVQRDDNGDPVKAVVHNEYAYPGWTEPCYEYGSYFDKVNNGMFLRDAFYKWLKRAEEAFLNYPELCFGGLS